MKNLWKIKIYFVLTCILVIIAGYFIATQVEATGTKITKSLASIKYRFRANAAGLNTISFTRREDVGQAVPVIVYHGLLESDDSTESNFTMEKFQDHMFSLKKAHYNAITSADLLQFMQGKIKLPQNPVLITFDDGRTDSFKFADPILRAIGYKATMFAIGTYSVGESRKGQYYLTPKELKEMQESRVWDIQAHSHDGHGNYPISPDGDTGHFFGSAFWIKSESRNETNEEFSQRISEDMRKVKTALATNIKSKIISFAYPFGDFGQNNATNAALRDITLEKTKDLYNLAFYQNAPGYRYTLAFYDPKMKDSQFFPIRRITIDPAWSGADLVNRIADGQLKKLPYEDNFIEDNGWVSLWGKLKISPNDLNMKAGENDSGGDVVLDGSQLWKNYSVTTEVNSAANTGVYIMLRYKDDNNYSGCNFANGFVHAEEIINGKTNVIKGTRSPNIRIPSGDFTLKAVINERNLECTMGDITVSTEFLDESIDKGGVGFKVWDKQLGLSDVHVRSISIKEI